MSKPQRIQLSRKKGWRLAEASRALNGLEAVKVDRTTRWGNPFCGPEYPDRQEKTRRFRAAVLGFDAGDSFCPPNAHPESYIGKVITDGPKKLRGKNLACWCPLDQPCHADVLLELANVPEGEASCLR